ncbi:MAG: TetR/AcrR family transcriptional regulator [Proteobacteria bacterium]|nr:TetR/AcrR family transcriptional regulator [Pseudomonadota bacterium]MBI3500118.1 TetR/AcrR family transcriptional regulator [Pseudomonadota bacterium]
MRITREEAAGNRVRIVEAAAQLFNEKGFDGVGVADLMNEAGLTHGGFYNHFASKEELEAAACDLVFDKAVAALLRNVADKPDPERRAAFADYVRRYLSEKNRDAAVVCPMVALSNDAVRQGPAIRQRFAEGVRRYLDALGRAIRPPGRMAAREKQQVRAQSIAALAMLVGGLLLARGVKEADLTLSDEILETLRSKLKDGPSAPPGG